MPALAETIALAMDQANRGRTAQAADELRRHLPMHPGNAELHEALGLISARAGQGDQALYHFEKAASLAPTRADYISNYATSLTSRGRWRDAASEYRKAVKLSADFFPAWLGLASTLMAQGEAWEAAEAARRAAQVAPARPEAWSNLGLALLRCGRTAEVIATLQQALTSLRDHPHPLSLLVYTLNFRPEADPAQVVEEHRRMGRIVQQFAAGALYPSFSRADPRRPLRVGYLSADFRDHATGRLIAPVLRHHDREQFQTCCYSAANRPDSLTESLRSAAANWADISRMGDEQIESRIRADGIDILVELDGYAPGSRISALARRLAPVQVSWLYRNTTGVREVDYRLLDARVQGEPIQGAERATLLEPCLVCFDPPRDAPAVAPAPVRAAGHATFGCFCPVETISEAAMSLWGRVLNSVSGSRLVVSNPALASSGVREDLKSRMAAAGCPAERLELLPPQGNALDAYARVDAVLDAVPAGGTAETMEALWMGVPVIALSGRTQASRMGPSILAAAGLPEWIAETEDQYIDLASGLASDPGALAATRAGLRDRLRASPLCDAPGFVRRLEGAYREMWQAWCARQ